MISYAVRCAASDHAAAMSLGKPFDLPVLVDQPIVPVPGALSTMPVFDCSHFADFFGHGLVSIALRD